MEYESHFTGEETKAVEGQGVQARVESMSTDSKAEGLLLSVVASVLYTLWLSSPVHQSHAIRAGTVHDCLTLGTPMRGRSPYT